MERRYVPINEPDGTVSLGVNHDVNIPENFPKPEHGVNSLTFTARPVQSPMQSPSTDEGERFVQPYHPYGIGPKVTAALLTIFAFCSVVTKRRIIDSINFLIICLTFAAVHSDSILSLIQLVFHCMMALLAIIPSAAEHMWGQLEFHACCVMLTKYCLIRTCVKNESS